MAVMVRWLVIQMKGTKLWPGYHMEKLEGFKKLMPAERLAEELAAEDHEENDYIMIWDLALNRAVWGPR